MTTATVSRPTTRPISHTETATALDCFAKWDFSYGGHLAGDALHSKSAPILLRRGRAWGVAVATFHGSSAEAIEDRFVEAVVAMRKSLEVDAEEQRQAGLYLPEEHQELDRYLTEVLNHYARTSEPLSIVSAEERLEVAIPSRTGVRASNRYRLLGFLDGIHIDAEGRTFIVEYKLRGRLSDLAQIVLDRQLRTYAWAYREIKGVEPAGIIVDERLNAEPKPVKLNQDGRPSKVQSCSVDAYRAAGGIDPEVIEKLSEKRWQARHRIFLRPDEIDEAGAHLVSLAQLIRQLDSGDLYPVRNPSMARCPSCRFREICAEPSDREVVDALFDRRPPKREREEES